MKPDIDLDKAWWQVLPVTHTCRTMRRRDASGRGQSVTLGELLQMTEVELWMESGIGPATFDAIKEELAIRGLKLREGCDVPAKVVDARRKINEYARLKTRVNAEVRRKEGELYRMRTMLKYRTEPARISQSGGRVLVARD